MNLIIKVGIINLSIELRIFKTIIKKHHWLLLQRLDLVNSIHLEFSGMNVNHTDRHPVSDLDVISFERILRVELSYKMAFIRIIHFGEYKSVIDEMEDYHPPSTTPGRDEFPIRKWTGHAWQTATNLNK